MAGKASGKQQKLSERVKRLEERERAGQEVLREIIKSIDRIEERIDGLVSRKEMEKEIEGVEERMERLLFDSNDRFNAITERLDLLAARMNKMVAGSAGSVSADDAVLRIVLDVRREIEGIKKELVFVRDAWMAAAEDRIMELLREAERYARKGRVNAARRVYQEAVEVYRRAERFGGLDGVSERMGEVYNRISGG